MTVSGVSPRSNEEIRADLLALLDELFPLDRDDEPNEADLAAGVEWWARTGIWWGRQCRRAWAQRAALLVEREDQDRRIEELTERLRCGAVGHPTVTPESLIPCMLDKGHDGDHWSTSGCSGGAVHWTSERDALAAERDALLARAVAAEARAEELTKTTTCRQCGLNISLTDFADQWDALRAERDELRAKVAAVRERLEQLVEMHATVTDHTGERSCMHCDTVALPCDTHGVASLALAALAAASPGDEETT